MPKVHNLAHSSLIIERASYFSLVGVSADTQLYELAFSNWTGAPDKNWFAPSVHPFIHQAFRTWNWIWNFLLGRHLAIFFFFGFSFGCLCDDESLHQATFIRSGQLQRHSYNSIDDLFLDVFLSMCQGTLLNTVISIWLNFFLQPTNGSLSSLKVQGPSSCDHILISITGPVVTVPSIKSFCEGLWSNHCVAHFPSNSQWNMV